MAKKKAKSFLTQQREKLKAQKAAKKGGAIVKSKGSAIVKSKGGALAKTSKTSSAITKPSSGRRGRAAAKARVAAKGTKGSGTKVAGGKGLPKQTPKLPPASNAKTAGRAIGKVLKPLAPGLKGIGRVAGPLALGISGISTASDLAGSLKRGEGIVRLAKGIGKKKPKSEVTSRNRRGRPKTVKAPVKPAKRGMSNIPAKEGTGKGSPNDKAKTPVKSPVSPKKTSKGVSAPKPKSKAPVAPSKKVSASSGKNPYRMPQGAERKDRMSKVVADLKKATAASKKRQNAQMPKKPTTKKISRNEQNLRRRQGR